MIWVRSRKWVETLWEPVVSTAVISITSPEEGEVEIPDSPDMIQAVLRLQFDDVRGDQANAMSAEHARAIIEFLATMPPVACILVQCFAGISRSAAVAAAISRMVYGEDSFFFINYVPNIHVYRTILNEWQKVIEEESSEQPPSQ